jgi:hypothetical protein
MDPLDPDQAQRIVAAYAGVLERHDTEDMYPAPVTSLPYSKDTIKTAIRTAASTLSSMGQLTPDLDDSLEMAYLSLADYVDEEVSRLMREHRQAARDLAADGRTGREKKELPAWRLISETSATVAEIARSMADDTAALRDEYRRWRDTSQ